MRDATVETTREQQITWPPSPTSRHVRTPSPSPAHTWLQAFGTIFIFLCPHGPSLLRLFF
ncbi:hypothetical protein Sjap_006985 [Stephania japonica]|uniref:Uncharacterized protein n=1 Tax=Stephania japonica TaxID=461633 RepID=A0AAP0PK96_9MAGN